MIVYFILATLWAAALDLYSGRIGMSITWSERLFHWFLAPVSFCVFIFHFINQLRN